MDASESQALESQQAADSNGSLVRLVRRKLGWTQRYLAMRSQVSDRTVRTVERRASPVRERTLRRIVRALNLGIERDTQLVLDLGLGSDFKRLTVNDLCEIEIDTGRSRPAPEGFNEREDAFERLMRRQMPHQVAHLAQAG